MTLDEAKEEFKKDPTKRICRKPNYRPHNYMPVYFTFKDDVLMVHDQDKTVHYQDDKDNSDIGNVADFQKSDYNDWMLY